MTSGNPSCPPRQEAFENILVPFGGPYAAPAHGGSLASSRICYNGPVKKVISFDLDGTIVDGAYGNMVWLEGIPEKFAARHAMSAEEAKKAVKSAYDSIGEADLLWYDIDYWLRRFGLTVRPEDLLDEYVDHIRLLPHVAEVVRELNEKYILVIASNAARPFVEKELRRTGWRGISATLYRRRAIFGWSRKRKVFIASCAGSSTYLRRKWPMWATTPFLTWRCRSGSA